MLCNCALMDMIEGCACSVVVCVRYQQRVARAAVEAQGCGAMD